MAFQRTRMSADRTLMSVMRTSLSLIGFGFTIFQFFQKLKDAGTIHHDNAPRRFGTALVVLGVALLIGGIGYHVAYMRDLRRTREEMRHRGPGARRDHLPHLAEPHRRRPAAPAWRPRHHEHVVRRRPARITRPYMRPCRLLPPAASLLVALCCVPTGAAAQAPLLHRPVATPGSSSSCRSPGRIPSSRRGYQRHLSWHRTHRDPWTWRGWSFVLGSRLDAFMDGTFGHELADFDHAVDPAGDGADNRVNVEPYASFLSHGVYERIDSLGAGAPLPDDSPGSRSPHSRSVRDRPRRSSAWWAPGRMR